ncbi:unnamed protein product [Gulo gulo]|uniref:Uncharacterized protein n=1 Tax=Gulo gulo TaxID=48420 RepID=A0A9X9PU43_GULGU|nr:unnamed protein product [Gulo gulo]
MIVSNSCSVIKGSKGVDDVIKDSTDYFQKNSPIVSHSTVCQMR